MVLINIQIQNIISFSPLLYKNKITRRIENNLTTSVKFKNDLNTNYNEIMITIMFLNEQKIIAKIKNYDLILR